MRKKIDKKIALLSELGFNEVTFPIIIKDGRDLDVVYQLNDFAIDPDWFYHEFHEQMELIDSKAQLMSWKYDRKNKTNLPGTLKRTLSFEEVNEIIINYFKNTKIERDIQDQVQKAVTIEDLINIIADKL